MRKYLVLLIFSCIWGCESNTKPIGTIVTVDTVIPIKSLKDSDSLFYCLDKKGMDPIWVQSDFDSAVAVILNGSHDIMYNVLKMDKMYARSSKRTLNEAQLSSMVENLSGKVLSSYRPADCYSPYHGFYFYKKGKIKARIAICFSCGGYYSLPAKSGGIDYDVTKQVLKDLGLPVYNWDDSTEIVNSKIKYEDYFRSGK